MSLSVMAVPDFGPEDIAVATDGPHEGSVFTGTEDGSIYRLSHDGRKTDRVAHTGGRPLGIEIDPDGRLVVCDADRGVVRVDPATGGVEPIADSADGRRMLLVDNAAIGSDGTVWFSDSSTKYGLERWRRDFGQHTRTGRLLKIAPAGDVEVVLDGLAFANGVTISRNADFVAVAETGARTVVRHWLTGSRAGMRDLLCQNLPGYPDNVALGSDGLIWVAIASPTDPIVERLHKAPMALRRALTAAPERLQPQPKRTVRVQAYDDEGTLVHDVDLPPSGGRTAFHAVTGVREHDGRIWLSSVFAPAIAVHVL